MKNGSQHLVLILAFDGVTLTDIISSAEVFSVLSNEILTKSSARYRVAVASIDGGKIHSSSGLVIESEKLIDIEYADVNTLIVPGGGPASCPPIPALEVEWIKENSPFFSRICSVCTGAFLLAASGISDNRRVTTHWKSAQLLKKRFPKSTVIEDSVFIKDRNIWTSAGFSAGIDMALSLIEEDHGHSIAMEVAQTLVVFMKRPEGQSQVSSTLNSQTKSNQKFSRLHAWIVDHISDNLNVDILADQMAMSPRTFARKFAASEGETPSRFIEKLRVNFASIALLNTDSPIKKIATENGFSCEQNLHRSFLKLIGVTPKHFRTNNGLGASARAPNHLKAIF